MGTVDDAKLVGTKGAASRPTDKGVVLEESSCCCDVNPTEISSSSNGSIMLFVAAVVAASATSFCGRELPPAAVATASFDPQEPMACNDGRLC